jgi:alkylation response protein AidB-like acyl-CoA dehydrogenase
MDRLHDGYMTDLLDATITNRQEFLDRAAACGSQLEANASRYDREGAWASDSFEHVRQGGLLALGVPAELGGPGATISELAAVQRELAKHCGSTALASSMHQHVTAFTAWRWRRGLPGAEATLRRIHDDGIVLVSTGGADFTHPRGSAVRTDGGYLVTGRKIFVSQSPAGTVMSTMFAYDDPERGLRVLNMAIPLSSDGVRVIETWDAMGMRGTASNDVELTDVFVPDERVLADRPHGVVDPPLQVILSIAFPIISAVYLGIAEGVRDHVLTMLDSRRDDVIVQRQVGLIEARLRVAGWALEGALRAVGDDPHPSMTMVADVMAMKREVALAGIEVCDLAMELVGGPAYFRGSPIERAYRDIRACKFHPFTPEATLVHAGRLALGLNA